MLNSITKYLLVFVLGISALSYAPSLLAQEAAPPPATETLTLDPLTSLLDVLKDDAARTRLIEELEKTTSETTPSTDPSSVPEQTTPEPAVDAPLAEEPASPSVELRSIGGQISDVTQEFVESSVKSLKSVWRDLSNSPQVFSALKSSDFGMISHIFIDLALLILITYGGFFLMRIILRRAVFKTQEIFATGGWIAKPFAVFVKFSLNIIEILVPWAIGYAVAVVAMGDPGKLEFNYSLYLNAFLMTEFAAAVVRLVLSPSIREQRLLRISGKQAKISMIWSWFFIAVFVYGQMLVLPLVNRNISFSTGRAVSAVLMLFLLVLMAGAIIRARATVAGMMLRFVKNSNHRSNLRGLLGYWYIPALFYIFVLAILVLTHTTREFQTILLSNVQVAIAIVVGMIVSNLLNTFAKRGVRLSRNLADRVPTLEANINQFVPLIVKVLKVILALLIVIFSLNALGLISVFSFAEGQIGARVMTSLITISLISLVGFILWLMINAWVEFRINPQFSSQVSSRERTLLVLLRNALTIAVVVISLMFILSELGINIAPLLASAGVLGLAIGFGSQKLVQDIITGVFIQLEGAIDVGDVVSVAGITGTVERLTVRSVSLRDAEGSYYVIPFSSVTSVTNFMRGHSYAVVDIKLPYRTDTDSVKLAMVEAFERLKKDPIQGPRVIGEFEWNGVESFSVTEMMLRAKIKTRPGKQWAVKRAYNNILEEAFLYHGIAVPLEERATARAMAEVMIARESTAKAKAEKKRVAKNPEADLPDADVGTSAD